MRTNNHSLVAAVFAITTMIAPQSFGVDIDKVETKKSEIEIGHIGLSQGLPNQYRIDAWMDGSFQGWAARSWDTDDTEYRSLFVSLDQHAGGYDATMARDTASGVKINNTSFDAGVYYDIGHNSLSGSGVWWCGAKVILSTTPHYSGLAGTQNYECYIVEHSDMTPAQIPQRFSYLVEVGQFNLEGAVYKHYKGRLPVGNQFINQIFSIRQNRQSGSLVEGWIPVGVILKDQWERRGFVGNNAGNRYYQLGWLSFLETQGRNVGGFYFAFLGFFGT